MFLSSMAAEALGKDTVCVAAARFWKAENISSITPILQCVAYAAGWDGRKTPEARRFLSRLKRGMHGIQRSAVLRIGRSVYHRFLQGDAQILFVHIREPEEIDRFRSAVGESCSTILGAAPCLGAGARRFGKPFG